MSDARELIAKLLSNIGGRKEVTQYLKHYCAGDEPKHAVVEITREVLEEHLDPLAASLSFLHRVGLHPVAVLDAPIPDTLFNALLDHGCLTRQIAMHVVADDTSHLGPALSNGEVPIVVRIGADVDSDPQAIAHTLTSVLKPHKLIVLKGGGGWRDEDGRVLNAINLAEDARRIARMSSERQQDLRRIGALLDKLPAGASVSITSPEHLARELFTHRGAGTLIRRGEQVVREESFDALDTDKLRELLESCFGRQLAPSYFDDKNCYRTYVAEDYRATAILTQERNVPYLDKFAVTHKAQGEGLGGTLWRRMRRDNDKLFWRAQSNNAVNTWYFQQADGSYKNEHWTVFWYGMDDFDEIRLCVEAALAMPETLKAHGSSDD